jgi:ketosteroid isomerase-like protein
MKRLVLPLAAALLVAALLSSAPTACAASPSTSAPSDEAQLREIKLKLWPKAYREQDAVLLDRILDESFQSTDSSGARSTKADEIAWVRANRPGYDSFHFEIERLDVYDGQSAIVSGLGTVRGSRDGVPYVTRYRSTNVLVKRDGQWRAVASHVSTLEVSP